MAFIPVTNSCTPFLISDSSTTNQSPLTSGLNGYLIPMLFAQSSVAPFVVSGRKNINYYNKLKKNCKNGKQATGKSGMRPNAFNSRISTYLIFCFTPASASQMSGQLVICKNILTDQLCSCNVFAPQFLTHPLPTGQPAPVMEP